MEWASSTPCRIFRQRIGIISTKQECSKLQLRPSVNIASPKDQLDNVTTKFAISNMIFTIKCSNNNFKINLHCLQISLNIS